MRLKYYPTALALAALALAAPAMAEAPFNFETAPGKLPKDVRPRAYRIDIVPNLDTLNFQGREEIDIEAAKPTDTITLNANGLTFASVTLKGEDSAKATVTIDAKAQSATLHFPHMLSAGLHTLAIAWSGKIGARPEGIYYNDYDAPGGRKRMLTTQFEAIDARRMFPGWDEPAFKATFTLSAVLPSGFRAISNMPIVHEEPAGAGKKKVSFDTTPKMSTYLLVLVAGDLDRIQGTTAGTEIGVDAVKGKGEQGRYALESASKILPYYNDYFGVDYPLPKLDLIAIPGNYAFSAMENWGGITFIDNALLFDPAASASSARERVFNVVSHEMAHQWSGDLVTMAWWDNIWLNEGFANWMEDKATDHFNPTWKVWLRSHADKEQAMAMDARSTTHPVQQTISDETQTDGIFDDITYEKGESFIRMLEAYLGEAPFRDGMRRYMKAHAYSNSTTADLWGALEQASGKPVSQIAAGFVEQPGIPLVHVDAKCIEGNTVATLTQDRFAIHDPAATKLRWQIPVTISRFADAEPVTLLLGDTQATAKFAGCGRPVVGNFGDTGYYRVEYDPANMKGLTDSYYRFAPADRVSLLADAWAMVEAGRADAASFLELTRHLSDETELVVWTQVTDSLRQIDDLARGSPDRAPFRAYARGLLRPVLDRLGWDARPNEPIETPLLRSLAINTLGRLGDQATLAEAHRRFDAFLKDPASLPPSIRDAVLTIAGHSADRRTYDRLRALGRAASGTEAKLRYYYALAGASDPALMEETIGIAATDEVPNGRVNQFVTRAASGSDDPERVWRLFLPNRSPVLAKLTAYQSSSLLPRIASASASPAISAELKTLPLPTDSAAARAEVAKAVEEIAFKAEFKERLLPSLAAWIKTNADSPVRNSSR